MEEKISKMHRRIYRNKCTDVVSEINEAWRQRDFAKAWNLAPRLSGTRYGPKRRRMNEAVQVEASQHWLCKFQQKGCEGGASAVVVDIDGEHSEELIKAYHEGC